MWQSNSSQKLYFSYSYFDLFPFRPLALPTSRGTYPHIIHISSAQYSHRQPRLEGFFITLYKVCVN